MVKHLEPVVTDLGEFSVARILPNSEKRMVGPFVFLDHMGPAEFAPGQGVNVRPHPHIGLATLTYLITGSILHRDSLGNCLEIHPGDVNWMVAGKGITHSERETLETLASQHSLNGLQCWVALPKEYAEIDPSFEHVSRFDLPHYLFEGVSARLVIGEAYGLESRLKTFSPMFLLDVTANQGVKLARPNPDQECLIYLEEGGLRVDGLVIQAGASVLVEPDANIEVLRFSRMILLGGKQWESKPHLEWNFVSFDRNRIAAAAAQWERGEFPPVIGDDDERIPFPAS
ncbi:pirin family protein [Arenicella xantha]|uniref:Pirin family protein n=1 Tax=Arenicella xantha TaxID=644221 RepID=A0A395JL20_9GAMM|nr:pirin family protein [Arenicella xantha]RBP51401.1 hypothetical protein DFR28_102822 [Arenicella xantha]